MNQLKSHDHGFIDLQPAISELGQLKGLPHNSHLRSLGYFAIIESLLTHLPTPSDPYDSITRQIKKKLTLLSNRSPQRIDYSAFSTSGGIETLWGDMYSYRSAVAHGGTVDFTKKLKRLRGQKEALSLAKATAKAVVRFCLDEPQLAKDLKDC